MKSILQNPRLRKTLTALKPWGIFIGVFILLKVTGLGSEISNFTQGTLLKAGVMDVEPENLVSDKQTFDYNFSVRDLDGKKLSMADLKGKVIFINLWATWCGPCRVEMPSIQKLYDDVDKDKVAFVMLSLDQERDKRKIEQFINSKQFNFPVYQPATPLPKLLRVTTIPTTFIIGPDGKVAAKKVGMANYDTDEMRSFIEELASGG